MKGVNGLLPTPLLLGCLPTAGAGSTPAGGGVGGSSAPTAVASAAMGAGAPSTSSTAGHDLEHRKDSPSESNSRRASRLV